MNAFPNISVRGAVANAIADYQTYHIKPTIRTHMCHRRSCMNLVNWNPLYEFFVDRCTILDNFFIESTFPTTNKSVRDRHIALYIATTMLTQFVIISSRQFTTEFVI